MSKRVLQEMLGGRTTLDEGAPVPFGKSGLYSGAINFDISWGTTNQGLDEAKAALSALSAACKSKDGTKAKAAMKELATALERIGWSINDGGPLQVAWRNAGIELKKAGKLKTQTSKEMNKDAFTPSKKLKKKAKKAAKQR